MGTVESAVEAMKLGAVDFIQKPFSPAEIRELAIRVMAREVLEVESAVDYPSLIELTKRCISNQEFPAACETVRKAIAADPAHPEAYNLLGVLLEIKGGRLEAQKFYRAALDMDPTFKSAWANLDRTTSWHKLGKIDLGPDRKRRQGKPMKNSKYIVVVGCGRLGSLLANRLSRDGNSVVVIDPVETTLDDLSPDFSGFRINGDATHMAVLNAGQTEKRRCAHCHDL
jgi:K+ transport systems, NAD-binding component